MLYIVINVFIGGPLENQLVEGQPSLKELNMKYEYEITKAKQEITKYRYLLTPKCAAAAGNLCGRS